MTVITKRVGGLAAVVSAMAMIVLLAGCSASGGSDAGAASAVEPATGFADTSGNSAFDASGSSSEADTAAGSGAASGRSSVGKSTAGTPAADDGSALPSGAQIVRAAGQTVRVDDVRAAAARARTAATALGGYVASENLYLGNPGDPGEPKPIDSRTGATSSLTLRVPQKSTDTALDRLAGLGKELNRTSTADDVTAQVADLDSRVKTQKASVERVRALLDRAKSLKDVVLLEGELSSREEELEAGQARSRALHDQAALATINLELLSEDSPLPAPGTDDGFLHGLSEGWDALGRSTVAVLTGVGAVLPFAVLLAVIGVPGLLVWRRRSARPPVPQTIQTSAGPDQP